MTHDVEAHALAESQLDDVEAELRDFLAADMLSVPVDPVFKERLRRELWEIVEQNAVKWRAARPDEDAGPAPKLDLEPDSED